MRLAAADSMALSAPSSLGTFLSFSPWSSTHRARQSVSIEEAAEVFRMIFMILNRRRHGDAELISIFILHTACHPERGRAPARTPQRGKPESKDLGFVFPFLDSSAPPRLRG